MFAQHLGIYFSCYYNDLKYSPKIYIYLCLYFTYLLLILNLQAHFKVVLPTYEMLTTNAQSEADIEDKLELDKPELQNGNIVILDLE